MSISAHGIELSSIPSDGQSVCLSVCVCVGLVVQKEYCGKTADWIRMPFGMVSGVSQEISVFRWGGHHKGNGQFCG